MPTYTYACPKCRQSQDVTAPMGQDAAPTCCDQPSRKRFTAAAVTFKGSGFYRTDSRTATR